MSVIGNLEIQIGRIPLPRVLGAYNKLNANPDIGAKKADCVKWLALGVHNGHFTLDDKIGRAHV